MHVPEFIASRWQHSAGNLLVGSVPASEIAARYGTPLFVYDRGQLQRSYGSLRDAFPEKFSICYSVKANPNAALLNFFLAQRCGLEIASGGEMHLALAAGCSANDILFAGPGKTEAELEVAIVQGIGEIHAESELEVRRISAISARLGTRTTVAVRVNPGEAGQGGAMRMGGKSAPFGVDEEHLEPLVHRILDDPHLDFCGIHLFAGTQILDFRVLLAQYRAGLEIARRIGNTFGVPLRTLDFGGGLGVPYFSGDSELDLDQLKSGILDLITTHATDDFLETTRFVIEPGRFLVAEAGLYVARVNDIKVSRGKKYLILDGGMNHHLAASGNMGQVIKRNFPIAILNRFDADATETVDVVGPLCTPLDTLGRAVRLPKAEVGDLIGVFQSGAYARAASPLGFLSHLTPPEVLVADGDDILVRRRGTHDDLAQDLLHTDVVSHAT
jgi:diaminopimelate decarboxylase